jgi:hypothetical protein
MQPIAERECHRQGCKLQGDSEKKIQTSEMQDQPLSQVTALKESGST